MKVVQGLVSLTLSIASGFPDLERFTEGYKNISDGLAQGLSLPDSGPAPHCRSVTQPKFPDKWGALRM